LAGAAIGALSAAAGIDARVQLAVCAGACAAVGLPWTRRLLGADAEGDPMASNAGGLGEPPRAARRRLIALGLLAFCCLLCEGAAADWSAVYVDRSLAASAAVAALAYTAFSTAMAFGRLAGDGLTARVGSVALVRRGAVVAAAGMGAALLAGRPAAALVGFACLGAGLATIIPAVFRAAATIPGTRSAPSLAAVSTTGYLGFVAGPPLIGALAELASLPVALAALPALAAVIAVAARVVRPARPQAEPAYLLSDLDGVLVDSGDAVERAWRWWAADRGVEFAAVEDAIHGRPSREVVASVAPGSDPAAESERIERFQATDLEGVRAVPGARELLESWPAERVAVVTSASEPLAHARLRHAGVPVPATMVTVEQVANGKPAPDGYLAAAAALGADPERCIVLEDAPAGVRAARAAGMRVVAVLTTHRRDELPGAAAYVDDLRGVADLIS
jgi:HAD superfamily hydrolase (TIGR01509 family)